MRGMPNLFCIRTALQYVIFFYIGFKIRQNRFGIVYRIPWHIWFLLHSTAFLILRLLPKGESMLFEAARYGIQPLLYILGAIMAFTALQRLAEIVNWEKTKLCNLLSNNSMGVYLLHMQIVYFSMYIFNGLLHPILHGFLNFVFALFVSIVLAIILRSNKITRIVVGE